MVSAPHGPEHDCFMCADARAADGQRPLVPLLARLTPEAAAVVTGAGSPSYGEAKNLVLSTAAVVSGPFSGRRHTDASRYQQAASRLGISYRAYRRHILQGDKWCSGHRRWHPRSAFTAGLRNTWCVRWRRAYERARYRGITTVAARRAG